MIDRYSLPEICALQWKACVERAEYAFLAIPQENFFRLSYESFVNNPCLEYKKIANFLGKEVSDVLQDYLIKNVSQNSVGKGKEKLSREELLRIRPIINGTFKKCYYS